MDGMEFTAEIWIVLAISVAAVGEDLWRRQVSNWTSLAALVGGFAWQIWNSGLSGAGSAALGCVVGFVVFLVFYVLGGMGGGDVKLMAGFGALLGPGRCLEAAYYTAIAGAVLAGAVLGAAALKRLSKSGGGVAQTPRSIPYAPAIAIGVLLALVPH